MYKKGGAGGSKVVLMKLKIYILYPQDFRMCVGRVGHC